MQEYMNYSINQLGVDSPIKLRILPTEADVFDAMAKDMFGYLKESARTGKPVCMVVPVGPVGQYEQLVRLLNESKVSCKNAVFINMDEYCDEAGNWVAKDDPVSFRGYMEKRFFGLLDEDIRPKEENCLFPDPADLTAIARKIVDFGGIDVVFGGIGINGHVAFNEPIPELSVEEYYQLPTRVLELSDVTKVMNGAFTARGNLEAMPPKCVTIGFKEIYGAKRIALYCFRHWQSAAVRKALHGKVSTACPASLLQTHPNSEIIISELVAQTPIPSVL